MVTSESNGVVDDDGAVDDDIRAGVVAVVVTLDLLVR